MVRIPIFLQLFFVYVKDDKTVEQPYFYYFFYVSRNHLNNYLYKMFKIDVHRMESQLKLDQSFAFGSPIIYDVERSRLVSEIFPN